MSAGEAPDEVLALDAVRHGYNKREVLRGVSLQLRRGEVAVLVGSSGSGKTTLLRLVAGLERPQAGRVLLRGVPVADGATGAFLAPERRGLGMVFQDAALWPQLRAVDNVAVAMAGRGGRRSPAVERLLEEVGLEGMGHRWPSSLSGGQKQRVALARALATGTDLLLLDEPLSALDEPVRVRLRLLIRDVVRRRNGSALMVSHDRTDAWRLADRIVVLEHGSIAQAGTPGSLYAAPATESVARYMGAAGAIPVRGLGGRMVWCGGEPVAVGGASLGIGASGVLVAYPEAVTIADRGLAARLVDRVFEAGRWRGRWRLAAGEGELEALHDHPPPAQAMLAFSDKGTFVFPRAAPA